MDETKACRKHPVLDMPVVGPVFLLLYAEIAVLVIGMPFYMVLSETAFYFTACLIAPLMIAIHRLWFRDYRGGLYMESLRDSSFRRIFLGLVAVDTLFCLFDMAVNPFEGLTATGISTSLMAGLLEEVESRYLLISVMMRRYKDRGSYLPALLFTAVTFGLSHYINVTDPSDFWPTTLQVIVTIASGFAMGAVFIRTGNIAVTMAWHFLHDILCSMSGTAVVANPVFDGVSVTDLVECGLIVIVYVTFGILLLKGQKENIMKVWRNRWSGPEAETAEA